MDIQTIDNQYAQLQGQARQTVGELQALAQKLQAAAQAGNQDAREWFLDLKSIAIAIQAEQNQVANLLGALHNYAAAQAQQLPQSVPQSLPQGSPWGNQPNTATTATLSAAGLLPAAAGGGGLLGRSSIPASAAPSLPAPASALAMI